MDFLHRHFRWIGFGKEIYHNCHMCVCMCVYVCVYICVLTSYYDWNDPDLQLPIYMRLYVF
jgi:hypothetical protein